MLDYCQAKNQNPSPSLKDFVCQKNQKGPQPPTPNSKFNCKGVFSIEIEY